MNERPPGTTTTRDVRMQVAGYRIQDILGDGASAVVFEAFDAQGRNVALKVLKPELALSEKERRRFVEEAARMRRVRHPSLVELVDAGELPEGGAYIAMARVPGVTLADRLAQGPIRFDVLLTLFEQLADALGVLHAQGLVHRDVKPENIFIEQGDKRAILLDLGIARDLSSDPSTTTRAGMIRGTPAYMAPERFFGKSATPQTDIYELGVVLYYALVGALPWSSYDNPTERLKPLMPAERGVVLPPRLTTVLMRALSADADKRPTNAAEFGAAVTDALSPESLQWIAGERTARGLPPASTPSSRARTAPMPSTPHLAPRFAHGPPAPMMTPMPMPAPTPMSTANAAATKRAIATNGVAIIALALLGLVGAIGVFAWVVGRSARGAEGAVNDPKWRKPPTAEELERFRPIAGLPAAPPRGDVDSVGANGCAFLVRHVCELRPTHTQCFRAVGMTTEASERYAAHPEDPVVKQYNDACIAMLDAYRTPPAPARRPRPLKQTPP